MSERSARKVDPIVTALALVLRDIAGQRAAARLERRRTMTVVDGAKRDGGQAA